MKSYTFSNITVRPFPTVADLNNIGEGHLPGLDVLARFEQDVTGDSYCVDVIME